MRKIGQYSCPAANIECYRDIGGVVNLIGAERCKEAVILLECMFNLLAIVTNEVFSDGIDYDEETKVYIKYLGGINQKLVEMADEAVEVVYSVPMMIKD